ncbi:TNR16-like protein [Mya arenaria]|uniref:TNR16-like protein n=1 Tax=Mya arenaria TaxID=6604 RepID=A0ABY7FH58_MYAAR|nr:TNR16-like protein [Mya arenaria]
MLSVLENYYDNAMSTYDNQPIALTEHFDSYPPYKIKAGYREESCQTGQYYQEDINGTGMCRKCFVCPKGYMELSPCSKTTNRSCNPCDIGTTFSDKPGGICRNCTECKRGQFMRRQCLPYKDTSCRKCPKGTYNLDGESFGCKFCSVCQEHEDEISLCTQLQNRRFIPT